jgi:hypothetical protein
MREAIATYATRAAEKMRRYKVAAENIFVFMHTSTFSNDPFYSNGASARFLETPMTPEKWSPWPYAWVNGSGATASATRNAA